MPGQLEIGLPNWTAQAVAGEVGRFRMVVSKTYGRTVDVTYFRGVPTELSSYSFGDPFGDAAAVLTFPQISGFDDLSSEDVGSWLADFSSVDIYWVLGYPVAQEFADTIDPRTNTKTLSTASDDTSMHRHTMPLASDSRWLLPTRGLRQDVAEDNPKASFPTGWTDGSAQWIWPTENSGGPGPDGSDAPRARALFKLPFTCAEGQVQIKATGDNIMSLWCDGVLLIDKHDDWRTLATVSPTLSAGTHTITALVSNSDQGDNIETNNNEMSNPGGLLAEVRQGGVQLVRTTSATTRVIRIPPQSTKIWEGYVASMEVSMGEADAQLSAQCQGALFQLDRYLAKPAYPPRPVPHEVLLAQLFDPVSHPNLRTKALKTEWPEGWAQTNDYTEVTAYTPNVPKGEKYSGYSSRSTGAWDRALTGFAQELLAVMFIDIKAQVSLGNQWTIRKDAGRQPVLYVRDRFRPPDISLWYGQTGVTGSFSRDTTQMANIIYGEGTGTDGTVWRNAVVSNDGSSTGYIPLASSRAVFPDTDNPGFDKGQFVAEGFYKYGPGFGLDEASSSAAKSLARDQHPGWSGDITLSVDPVEMSRWLIRAGMTVRLQGFAGTGEAGMNFHIAEVNASPTNGSVSLTIDTRYRDLLNLEEARVRARDPLTPSKMLQLGKRSVMIEDIQAPWDYSAGSGFVPKGSTKFHQVRPTKSVFPHDEAMFYNPPRYYGDFYVRINADRPTRTERWTFTPVLMAQKGSIRRSEFVAVDVDGNRLAVPFHVSVYQTYVTTSAMPRDADGPSPFYPDAFHSTGPNGEAFPVNTWNPGDPSIRVGWGNADQKAGYSPGRMSDGGPPTGLLVDESTWTWDVTTVNPNFAQDARPGDIRPGSVLTLFVAMYAEWSTPIYIMGRFYRQEPGS